MAGREVLQAVIIDQMNYPGILHTVIKFNETSINLILRQHWNGNGAILTIFFCHRMLITVCINGNIVISINLGTVSNMFGSSIKTVQNGTCFTITFVVDRYRIQVIMNLIINIRNEDIVIIMPAILATNNSGPSTDSRCWVRHVFVQISLDIEWVRVAPFKMGTRSHDQVLKHWGWDKLAGISQTTFSNAFSWMKIH